MAYKFLLKDNFNHNNQNINRLLAFIPFKQFHVFIYSKYSDSMCGVFHLLATHIVDSQTPRNEEKHNRATLLV